MSIIYSLIPTIVDKYRGISKVISPLVALMEDQVVNIEETKCTLAEHKVKVGVQCKLCYFLCRPRSNPKFL